MLRSLYLRTTDGDKIVVTGVDGDGQVNYEGELYSFPKRAMQQEIDDLKKEVHDYIVAVSVLEQQIQEMEEKQATQ